MNAKTQYLKMVERDVMKFGAVTAETEEFFFANKIYVSAATLKSHKNTGRIERNLIASKHGLHAAMDVMNEKREIIMRHLRSANTLELFDLGAYNRARSDYFAIYEKFEKELKSL